MKFFTLVIATLLLTSCATNQLKYFANNVEIISETKNTVPSLSGRVFKLREFGECDGERCPKEVLYLAVSEFGEYPKQALYITPKASQWEFVRWDSIPILDENNPRIILTAKKIDRNLVTTYRIEIGLEEIKYNKTN